MFVQYGVRGAGGDGDVAAPALSVEACCDSDRLDKRRLAASVLAREERHVWVDLELVELPDRGDRERVGVEVVDLVALQNERTDKSLVHAALLRGLITRQPIVAPAQRGDLDSQRPGMYITSRLWKSHTQR